MTTGAQPRATFITAAAIALTSCALGSVYVGWAWLGAVLAAVAVVAATALLSRWARLPAALHTLVSAAALLVWTTARFAPDKAFARVVPTRASWDELVRQYNFGIHDLTTGSPPVAATTGTLIIATAGVGLIALAADLLAVNAQRPALAGLPMLTILAISSAARHGGIGIIPFLLAAIGYLLLLQLDGRDRSARWGRQLDARSMRDDSRTPAPAIGPSGGVVWRIGATTLGLALLIPVVIPGADRSPFHGSSGFGAGSSSSTTVINPLSTIETRLHESQTHDLLHVRTNNPTYQRLTALDDFGTNGFTLTPLSASKKNKIDSGGLAPITSPPNATITQETLTAEQQLAENFLPVAQNPTAVTVDGDWLLSEPTATIFSTRTTTSGKTWNLTAAVPDPTAAQLQGQGVPDLTRRSYPQAVQVDLEIPALPAVVKQTAQTWVADAHATTTYEIANAIQSQFTGPAFTYDLQASIAAGPAGFVQFLQVRRGYCQQFATTMVAMLRSLGIPSRVAIGFTEGTKQADGTYLITNRDAHAWPEVWFPTSGWVRFEPTPLSNGNALTPSYSTEVGPSGPSTATPTTPGTTGSASATPTPTPLAGKKAAGTGGSAPSSTTSSQSLTIVWIILGLLAFIGILAVPWLLRCLPRRARWRAVSEARPELRPALAAEAAWANIMDDASDRGVQVPSSASPRQAGRILAAALSPPPHPTASGTAGSDQDGLATPMLRPKLRDALALLVGEIETVRYGRGRPLDSDVDPASGSPADLRRAAEALGLAMARRQGRRERFLVTLFPPSTRTSWTTPFKDIAGRIAAGIDSTIAAVENFGNRLSRKTPRDAQ